MRRILAVAAVSGLCSLAAPAGAQSLATANPCGIGKGGNGGGNAPLIGINLGFSSIGTDKDCTTETTVIHLWLMWQGTVTPVNPSGDLKLHDAAIALLCSEQDMREVPNPLCGTPTPPQAVATVALVPQLSAAAPPVVAAPMTPTPVQVPSRPYIAPQQVAMASFDHPSVMAKPCTPPAGVPASMWSGCWAR